MNEDTGGTTLESERALLAAAAEVISESGITGASLASIGARARTSRGLPTVHFGRKMPCLTGRHTPRDRVLQETFAGIEQAHRQIGDLPALDLLRATVSTYLRMFESPRPMNESS